jgi:hypothetical protein
VRKIGSYSRSVDDIVKSKLGDELGSLEKKRKWLSLDQ